MEFNVTIGLYLAFMVGGIALYRWGVRTFFLSPDPPGTSSIRSSIYAFGVIFIPFTLWVVGILGLFNQSAEWGIIGLLIALVGLMIGVLF